MNETIKSEPIYPPEGQQADRVLKALLAANGDWVNGQYFLRELYFSQYHAVIFNLERRYNWTIEHSDFKDEFGFKSYRIAPEDLPKTIEV